MTNHLWPSYNPLPVSFVRGEGVWLYDDHDNRYLDAASGIAVTALGHSHPTVVQAIISQAQLLLHTTNMYQIAHAQALADKLCELSGMAQVFFGNSGAEANEAALKISRLYAKSKHIDDPQIIVMDKAFHGRTLATLSASGSLKIQAGFSPLVPGFIRVPFDDIDAVAQALANHKNVVAVMVEPIQGESGVRVPQTGYLKALRTLCNQHDVLLMLDEVQTGMGRTGRLFAYQYEDILPDVCTSAKALANGVPIGACLIQGKALNLIQSGMHGSTFGGNPLATHVGLAVLTALADDGIINTVFDKGEQFMAMLQEQLADLPEVIAIRGKGLIIGVELNRPCRDLMSVALDQGLLINVTADNVIRLLPPLIVSDIETSLMVSRLSVSLRTWLAETAAQATT